MRADEWLLLGAPWDCSATGRGEASAPDALRSAGLARLVDMDLGDATIEIRSRTRDVRTGILALEETGRSARALTDELTGALEATAGRRPLVIGGDCSILLGILPAMHRARGPIGLWFVDGHPDYQEARASDSGETADMDLALVTGDGPAELVDLAGPEPMVDAAAAVLIGHRTTGLDGAAQAELDRVPPALARIDADAVRADPCAAGTRAARLLADAGAGAWLHVDLDVLDPEALPAVTYPQPGGPDWEQLAELLMPLAYSPRLLGVSVADFRPDLDPGGHLATRVVELLDAVLP